MPVNSKILGAFVIGFALVAGSYTLSNFGQLSEKDQTTPDVYAVTTAANADTRTYIEVSDKNSDGVEDWQEEFVNQTPLVISADVASTTAFAIPNTVTDRMGIELFQSVLQAKGRGNVGPQRAQIVSETADLLRQNTVKDTLFTRANITVIDTSNEAIRTYANTLASILVNNNVPGSESELVIIDRALKTENASELNKLDPIIAMYKTMRDQTMDTPVPRGFEKQHLDLVNVYQALYATLTDFKLIYSDPVVALLRVKRYQDDATGLGYALQNMYRALEPHAALLQPEDPALVFAAFAPRR